jgi:hypothetical protein
MPSKELYYAAYPEKIPATDARVLHFLTKSGETRTLIESEYGLNENCLSIVSKKNLVIIPLHQILYFKITDPFEPWVSYPLMETNVKVMMMGVASGLSSPQFFSKVSPPRQGHHFSFMQMTEDKPAKVVTYYFPYSSVISVEVTREKEADVPT